MSSANARIIEKDIFADVVPASGGDSEIITLDYAGKFSCQAVYDVLSFSAAALDSTTDIFDDEDPDHPSQFFKTDHGFVTGLKVQIATDDVLPDPLVALTDYFVIKIDDDYFQLAASLADALAGTEIALVDAGTGTQTVTAVALAGASVTFKKSNDRTNWIDVQTATSITMDGSVMIEQPNVSYRYFKAVKAITAGAVDLKGLVLVIGDSV